MIPFIDNIEYNGPKPNFERDCMLWVSMQAVTNQLLDKGHIVYCIDPVWRPNDDVTETTPGVISVPTQEDLEQQLGKPLNTIAWVTELEKGFILKEDGEHAGHYVFLGMEDNVPVWAKIINEDGSIAGKLEIGEISDEFIDSLDDNL